MERVTEQVTVPADKVQEARSMIREAGGFLESSAPVPSGYVLTFSLPKEA